MMVSSLGKMFAGRVMGMESESELQYSVSNSTPILQKDSGNGFNEMINNVKGNGFSSGFNEMIGNVKGKTKGFSSGFNEMICNVKGESFSSGFNEMVKGRTSVKTNKFNQFNQSFDKNAKKFSQFNNILGLKTKKLSIGKHIIKKPIDSGFKRIKQQKGLSMFGDKDKDGVVNILDCQPRNRLKQGPFDEGNNQNMPVETQQEVESLEYNGQEITDTFRSRNKYEMIKQQFNIDAEQKKNAMLQRLKF